MVLENSVIWE